MRKAEYRYYEISQDLPVMALSGKKFGEGVTWYESHPPSLRTVYFPTAPYYIISYCGMLLLPNV